MKRRGPSLKRMAAVSAGLHLALLLLFGFSGFYTSRRYTAPNPYFVSLTAPSPAPKSRPATRKAKKAPSRKKKKAAKKKTVRKKKARPARKKAPALKPERRRAEPEPGAKPEETRQEGREREVEAEIARLRRIKQIEAARAGSGPSGGAPADVSARYHGLVRLKVQERWTYPGSAPGDLEAEVLIVIGPRGAVRQQKIVRGSGNREFDRSVLRAIAKASPFPPPPEGVDREIQFRFRPEGAIE